MKAFDELRTWLIIARKYEIAPEIRCMQRWVEKTITEETR